MPQFNLNADGRSWVDDRGRTWDTVAFRKLATGDYARTMTERHASSVMLQFGHAEGDRIVWTWAQAFSPQDAGWLVCDLGSAIARAAGTADAILLQAVTAKSSLDAKVVEMAQELRALKEGKDAS